MSYLTLNKRQQTGTVLEKTEFEFEGQKATIELIKLSKPYTDGTAYAVKENTKNAFCSNGLFVTENEAYNKYNLMRKNCNLITDTDFKKLYKGFNRGF